MRECLRCGEEYDDESFVVEIKGSSVAYRSALCKACVKVCGNAEIILAKEKPRKC